MSEAMSAAPAPDDAAVTPATAAPAAAAGATAEPSSPQTDWSFPVFVGGPRRLSPSDVLFEAGNLERERLAKQAVLQSVRDEGAHLAREVELHDRALSSFLAHKFECSTCHACLPTAHLLDIHVAEVHDSFFAAQAARRLPVYLCLVEACGRKYCTVEERRQHLVDHHRFPRGGAMGLDRIHLRRKKGQVRALPQYRKGNGGRHGMGMESAQAPAAASSGQQAEPAGLAPDGGGSAAAAGTAGSGSMQDEELPDVAHSLSRLSMAAEASTVPNVVSFGRRQPGRGIPGVQRGRGGQKVHKGFVD